MYRTNIYNNFNVILIFYFSHANLSMTTWTFMSISLCILNNGKPIDLSSPILDLDQVFSPT